MKPLNQNTLPLSLQEGKDKSNNLYQSKLTSLVKVPLQNSNSLLVLTDSSLPSFYDYIDQRKQFSDDKKNKTFNKLIKRTLNSTNNVIQYLQVSSEPLTIQNTAPKYIITNNLNGIEKITKIQDIKNNSQAFRTFDPTLYTYLTIDNKTKYYLETILNNSLKYSNKSKQKIFIEKLLKKIINKNRINDKTLISFFKYNKNTKKAVYNMLTTYLGKDKFNLFNNRDNGKTVFMKKQTFIKTINPFNLNLAKGNNIMYQFNKKNSYNIYKNEKNIGVILDAAFLSMDSIISKAYFSVKPESILINIFFFWKPAVKAKVKNSYLINFFKKYNYAPKGYKRFKLLNNLEYKLRYSKKFSKFAIIFENKLKILTWVLSKLLNKRVDIQATRIYYPYNDSNILSNIFGFLSFSYRVKKIILHIWKNVIFKIRRKRFFRLKVRKIPSVVTGVNIKIAGRISKVRSNRRVRSIKWQLGSLARINNRLTRNSRFTNKNRAGVYSISINSSATVF